MLMSSRPLTEAKPNTVLQRELAVPQFAHAVKLHQTKTKHIVPVFMLVLEPKDLQR